MIQAEKINNPQLKQSFTDKAWSLLPANKNGWREIVAAESLPEIEELKKKPDFKNTEPEAEVIKTSRQKK